VAHLLLGRANPSGKLPVSFPRSVGQVPISYDRRPTGRPQHANYLDLPATPLYPFGHGLSYTTFVVSNLRLSAASVPIGGSVTVQADVTNTGPRAGDEVAQLYVHDRVASVTQPERRLAGFQRVAVAPGARKTVTFQLPTDRLGFFDNSGSFVVEPGDFDVIVSNSSTGGVQARLTLTP
jgi:beta-glucosidase